MPRIPRLGLLVSLLAMVAVGTAGAIAAQAATGTATGTATGPGTGTAAGPGTGTAAGTAVGAVSQDDSDCGCEEGTGTCPTASPVPSPTATVPTTPPPLSPSAPASPPLPTYTLSPSEPSEPSLPTLVPFPSASQALELAGVGRIAAPTLVLTFDVDMTGFVNGQEITSIDRDGKRAKEVKSQCPKDAKVTALYTFNPFQGHLMSISFINPRIDMENCEVTIKVLDPATGRVLETYESPSELIVIVRGSVGFLHQPARIKVEVTCDR